MYPQRWNQPTEFKSQREFRDRIARRQRFAWIFSWVALALGVVAVVLNVGLWLVA